MSYNYYISIVRFLTAFLVLITHITAFYELQFFKIINQISAEILWRSKGLHYGVIIFVVMSGMLIEMSSKSTSLRIYYIKRLLRIYPVYIIALILGCVVSENTDFLIPNILLLPAIIPVYLPLGNEILITVTVEILIYIGYGFYRKFDKENIIFVSFLLYVINIFLFSYIGAPSSWIGRNFFALLIYWNIGLYFVRSNVKFKMLNLLLIFVLYNFLASYIDFPGAHYIYSLVFAVISGLFLKNIFALKNTKKFWLGDMAYSIYALHWPLLILITRYDLEFPIVTLFVGLIVSFLLFENQKVYKYN